MHIYENEIEALQSLYSEFEIIYRYADSHPCEDSNRVIADIVRVNAKTKCSIENMGILAELIKRAEKLTNADGVNNKQGVNQ